MFSFYHGATSLKYHAPDIWHDIPPSHITLTPGQLVLALIHKRAQWEAASTVKS